MSNRISRFVAKRIDRAVKDATPEHLARRNGESVPVWMLSKNLQGLGGEIDQHFGNGAGGVDVDEVAQFRRTTEARIGDAERLARAVPAGTSLEKDVLELVSSWKKKLVDADAIESFIRETDATLLQSVAGMLKTESNGVIEGIATRLGGALAKMQVNVTAGIGAGVREEKR